MEMANPNEKQLIQLPPGELSEHDYISSRWDVKVLQSVKPKDILEPSFWAHEAMKLKPLDEVRVHCEDGTWLGYYIVLDCSRTWAKVQMLSMHQLTSADVSQTQASIEDVAKFVAAHSIVHRGPHRWSVVRNSDKAVLHEGVVVKDDAITWLDKHARATFCVPTPRTETAAAPA